MEKISLSFFLDDALDLEEAAEPPDLEEGLANDNANDENVPPLDSGVCALSGVAVGALTHDNVLLLVLDLVKELREALDYRRGLLARDTKKGQFTRS